MAADDHPHAWAARAIRLLRDEARQHGPTPLHTLRLPGVPGIDFHLKDESAHPTGSLKHRLVRALFTYALAGGAIQDSTPVLVATGGPVAVAAAHFARLLDLPLTAVVPPRTPTTALDRITAAGGHWQYAAQPPAALQEETRALAEATGGHFLDHFTDAAPAVAGCGERTLADELFAQLRTTAHPVPAWLVTGAGTGATSATLGRHLHHHGHPTRLAVADPENSAYYPSWTTGYSGYATGMPSRIPGIGRPRVEPGFLPTAVDLVVPVPDPASVAALHWLHTAGFPAGPSTGTTFWAACHLAARMREQGARGSIALVMGDGAAPYRATHLDPAWLTARGLDPGPHRTTLDHFAATGNWPGA
ncbi:pyridoxal-phosphate dependent enzyme [Streptomyces albidoflavus]